MSLLLALLGSTPVVDDSETRAPLAEEWQPEADGEVALDQSVIENEVQALLADIADEVIEIDDLLNQLAEDAPPPDAPDFLLDEIADAEEPTTNLVEDVVAPAPDFLDALLMPEDVPAEERDEEPLVNGVDGVVDFLDALLMVSDEVDEVLGASETISFTEDFYDAFVFDVDASADDDERGDAQLLNDPPAVDNMEWLVAHEDVRAEPDGEADNGWLYAQVVAPVAAVVSEWIARARRRGRR